ncbi:HNH endonuclease [Actinoplanes italicus]|uniref:HNH endonuclease n=1 Tax=Actinoplanes italicus TaxID=113567 RepID=UPI0035A220A3
MVVHESGVDARVDVFTRRTDDAQIDHVLPKDLGGCGSSHNGCVACRSCNRDKTNETVEQWDARTLDEAGMLLDATGLNLINL